MDDLISRQAALDWLKNEWNGIVTSLFDGIKALPSAQPEYYDYSDIDDVWEFYAKEQDINLTDSAKQLKDAMWVGYRKGKQDAQQWTPCSEGVPEDEYVLISKKPSKISGSKWCVTIAERATDPRSKKVRWRDIGFGVIPDDKVLAWMPRPEPYKGEES